jgi:hypothetical protein
MCKPHMCETHIGANVAIFLGYTVCLEFALKSLLWGLQAAFCKLKSITDLQLGYARFPVTVTTVCRGVGGKLCTNLFLCYWLVFLTTCAPYTAKNPWFHKPLGVYSSSPDTDWGSGLWELISPEFTSIIKSCCLQSGLGDFVSRSNTKLNSKKDV